ncbi:hypothetical protein SBRCBS47491_009498 [Sporothrix bragantina]|uniref:Major facilitator superfamily (MFS) profile domain-containing protein n=1 Tax=Sporothrix bragantina TaxID=671064 RepID=A0ABP0CVF6_9PEZI
MSPLTSSTPSSTTSSPTEYAKESAAREKETPLDTTLISSGAPGGDQRSVVGVRWALTLIAIFSANLLYGLDTTISASIQATVSTTFENSITELGWLGYGFGLGSSVAILPLGKAYGLFNVKWLYLGCLVQFAAGSALCGAAPSMAALIVGRVWAGVGGAGMYLGTLNLMSTIPLPMVGGLLSDSSATWRWAFYLNLVMFGTGSPLYIFALPSVPRQEHIPVLTKLRKLDSLGIAISAGMYVSLALALSYAGTSWAWNSAQVIVLFVLAAVLFAIFGLTQFWAISTSISYRLFPFQFLASRDMVILFIATACGGAALFVSVYYIPLFFLFVHGDDATQAAVRLLPLVAFYVAGVLACSRLIPMTQPSYFWAWFFVTGLFMTAGGAALFTVNAGPADASKVYGFSLLLGIGLSTSQAGYYVATHHIVKAEKVPEAIQFLNASQGTSQFLGLLIASAVFQSRAYAGIRGVLQGQGNFTESQIRGAIAGAHSELFDRLSEGLRVRCLAAIVWAIQREWILVIAAGALMAVSSLFLVHWR